MRKMLESGSHATVAEIAAAEEINESYVGRVLRLTLLAPDIVEAILGGRQPAQMTLAVLIRPPVNRSSARSIGQTTAPHARVSASCWKKRVRTSRPWIRLNTATCPGSKFRRWQKFEYRAAKTCLYGLRNN